MASSFFPREENTYIRILLEKIFSEGGGIMWKDPLFFFLRRAELL
jgi:hypothetical protein